MLLLRHAEGGVRITSRRIGDPGGMTGHVRYLFHPGQELGETGIAFEELNRVPEGEYESMDAIIQVARSLAVGNQTKAAPAVS